MARLWVRIIKKHRIIEHRTAPCIWGDPQTPLTEICHELDIAYPIWLEKHEKEFEDFRRTAFTVDHFPEEINFDRMEIEYLDDEGTKRRSKDPRNQFDGF